ncbi:MAG TPA: hypothetical protein VNR39_07925 [Pseudolabrys sp.]|nr:hypothetical protein [Pseudolabrys sp.]
MVTVVDTLWLRLHAMLSAFAVKMTTIDSALVREIRRTANDAFLLRGYLALRKSTQGEELAISVDIQTDGQQLVVESDACLDDGRVVADGPSVVVRLSESDQNVEAALNDWLHEFEQFLLKNESAVVAVLSKLA